MLEAVPREIQNQNIILFAGMAELADALDSGSSLCKEVQVQVLLPAPKRDRRLLPSIYFLIEFIDAEPLQLAELDCFAHKLFSSTNIRRRKARFASPVTRTNKKESFGSLFVLVFLHHFLVKKCLLKNLFPTLLTHFLAYAILVLSI